MPIESFFADATRPDGFRNACKTCEVEAKKEYQRAYYQRRKEALIANATETRVARKEAGRVAVPRGPRKVAEPPPVSVQPRAVTWVLSGEIADWLEEEAEASGKSAGQLANEILWEWKRRQPKRES